MKLLFIFLLIPIFGLAQSAEKEPSEKIGPNPIFIIDSVRITKAQFQKFNPNAIASLTVITDTSATNKYGTDAEDGVILIETKDFARKHYISYFRKKSKSYNSLYLVTKTDTDFQYIINDKIKTGNFEGDLAAINDDLFISIVILTADDLKIKYHVNNKEIGVLIKSKKPKDLFNGDNKF